MNLSVGELHALRIHAGNGGVPQHLHAALFGSGDQPFVKLRPSQTNSWPVRKISGDSRALLRETYSAEFLSLSRRNFHAQVSQGGQRLRHHPFPARLFNRRRRTIRHDCLEPFLPRRDAGRQPRRPAANYEYIRTGN
jgi:hypothetical protein